MATRTALRRPGEPQPPRTLSDEQVAGARLETLERQRVAHEEWVDRLRERDPGHGRPPAHAEEARREQLSEMETHVAETERLRTAERLRAETDRRETGFSRSLRRAGLRKAAREGQSDEDKAFMASLREAAAKREREQEARRRIKEIAESRKHPPDPRASSISAAVLSSDVLWDLLRRLPRDVRVANEQLGVWEDGTVVETRLELADVGVLLVVLRQLENTASVLVDDYAGAPRLRIPDLPPIESGLRASLHRLVGEGLLEIEMEGGAARIRHGPRALQVAREAGVLLDGVRNSRWR